MFGNFAARFEPLKWCLARFETWFKFSEYSRSGQLIHFISLWFRKVNGSSNPPSYYNVLFNTLLDFENEMAHIQAVEGVNSCA